MRDAAALAQRGGQSRAQPLQLDAVALWCSAAGKSGKAKRRNICFQSRRISPKLSFQPCRDSEIAPGRHQPLGRVFGLVSLALLPIGDDKIDKAKSRIAGVVSLEGGNRFVDVPRQTARIAKNAKINGRMVRVQRDRFLRQDQRFFGRS